MQVITTEKRPIKLWVDDADEKTLEQARHLANLPFTFRHVALMPDAHMGYGMPIGGVLATQDAVIPNAVGVDIGCGMGALRTNLRQLDRDRLKALARRIRELVPMGFDWHKTPQDEACMPDRRGGEPMPVVEAEYDKARRQVGTLGGGNHFIEIQRGSEGHIWAMVHSGSRNIGKQVADHYNKLAVKLNEKWKSEVPKAWELAFLPLDSEEGQQYLREMAYCVAFAQASRALMLERVQEALREAAPEAEFEPVINIAHNYAAREKHYGREVVVHRKGATQAKAGQQGIIPGSQGAKSYIVRGKGNRESFESCSHGAGRRMGRKQAMRELDLKEQQALLEAQGIVHGLRAQKDLDEAPGAYKDIAHVMRNQHDLVDIETELTPLAALKA